ncbi:MAG: F0F1 ATP synthase subunit delta [Gammaproteobacteria bacterium]
MTIARPYAKATFAFATERNRVSEWQAMLAFLRDALEDQSLKRLIAMPEISSQKLVDVLIKIGGDQFDASFHNFIRVLIHNKRLPCLPYIVEQFEMLQAQAENKIEATVVTAVPVDASLQKILSENVAKRLNRDVEFEYDVDASIIAGALIRIQDKVIDGTVRNQLERMRESL